MNKTAEIFISYAWGDQNEQGESREIIVNELYEDLVAKGFTVIRDKVNLNYGGKISDFMKRIGEGKYVVVIVSDKYLKSEYCMYEVIEIRKNSAYNDRIFPIILSDADIFDEVNRLEYLDYWSGKRAKLEGRIRTLKELKDAKIAHEKLKLYDDIREVIGEFTGFIKDVNALSPDMHRDNDFKDLIALIERKHQQDLSAPGKQQRILTNSGGIDVLKKSVSKTPPPPLKKKPKKFLKYLIPLLLLPILIYAGMTRLNSTMDDSGNPESYPNEVTTNDMNQDTDDSAPIIEKEDPIDEPIPLKIGDGLDGNHDCGTIFYLDNTLQHGLVFLQGYGESSNWEDATANCQGLVHCYNAAEGGWRLPTEKEMYLLLENLNMLVQDASYGTPYWTSTEENSESETIYTVDDRLMQDVSDKEQELLYFPVRDF